MAAWCHRHSGVAALSREAVHPRPPTAGDARSRSLLQDAVEHVRQYPPGKGGMAPVYGLAATVPTTDVIGDVLERYIDTLYKV